MTTGVVVKKINTKYCYLPCSNAQFALGANLLPGANLQSDTNLHPLASRSYVRTSVPRFDLNFNTRFSVLRINSMC